MSIINRVPRGLQSLLDSKSLGVNPTELMQTVSPTVDLAYFWYADKPLLGAFASTVGGAIGTSASVTIPNGELWAVVNVAGECLSAAAADNPRFSLRVRGGFASAIANTLAESSPYITPAAGANETFRVGWTSVNPWLLGPGTNFDVFAGKAVNAGCTFTIRVAYYQLAI